MKIKSTARNYGQGYMQVIRTVSMPIPDPVLGTITEVSATAMSLKDGVDFDGVHKLSLCHPRDRRGVVAFERGWTRCRRMNPERYAEERQMKAAELNAGAPMRREAELYSLLLRRIRNGVRP